MHLSETIMFNRENREMAEIVNRGLFIMHLNNNIKDAACYMASHAVPVTVAIRVLFNPHLRRPTDWR